MLIQKIALRVAALVLCSTCLIAANGTDFVSAKYGVYVASEPTGGNLFDVTETIKSLINSGSTQQNDHRTMNQIFGGDSAPNQVKTLILLVNEQVMGMQLPIPKQINEYQLPEFWAFIVSERTKNTK